MNLRRLFSPMAAALLFLAAVSCTNFSSIPKRTMQKIYYDMFLADGYLESTPEERLATDSLSVYASIFEKYGYTEEEFIAAQNRLIDKPERLKDVLTAVKEKLDKRHGVIQREVAVLDSIAEAKFAMEQDSISAIENFLDSISYACLLDTLCVSFSQDTFAVEILDHAADTLAADSLKTAGKVSQRLLDAPDELPMK